LESLCAGRGVRNLAHELNESGSIARQKAKKLNILTHSISRV
jgi:hypothetical protein